MFGSSGLVTSVSVNTSQPGSVLVHSFYVVSKSTFSTVSTQTEHNTVAQGHTNVDIKSKCSSHQLMHTSC